MAVGDAPASPNSHPSGCRRAGGSDGLGDPQSSAARAVRGRPGRAGDAAGRMGGSSPDSRRIRPSWSLVVGRPAAHGALGHRGIDCGLHVDGAHGRSSYGCVRRGHPCAHANVVRARTRDDGGDCADECLGALSLRRGNRGVRQARDPWRSRPCARNRRLCGCGLCVESRPACRRGAVRHRRRARIRVGGLIHRRDAPSRRGGYRCCGPRSRGRLAASRRSRGHRRPRRPYGGWSQGARVRCSPKVDHLWARSVGAFRSVCARSASEKRRASCHPCRGDPLPRCPRVAGRSRRFSAMGRRRSTRVCARPDVPRARRHETSLSRDGARAARAGRVGCS